jgi:hypothetical protein
VIEGVGYYGEASFNPLSPMRVVTSTMQIPTQDLMRGVVQGVSQATR